MKNKLLCLFFPVASGLFTVFIVYMSLLLINYNSYYTQARDNKILLKLILLLAVGAYAIQALFILPFWAKFGKTICSVARNIVIIAIALAIISSVVMLAMFPQSHFSGQNLLQNALLCFVLFGSYWGINLHVLYKIVKN
ncbi:MAG: hypothetical protein CVU11_00250 [Bacteroidetes bacterium HGW-Bacteroidetes-6]|nr:MAG: hypothetical protein CVU11_00250 [Bacteroidetes bacterium HGW-Bacteroidetes-6]